MSDTAALPPREPKTRGKKAAASAAVVSAPVSTAVEPAAKPATTDEDFIAKFKELASTIVTSPKPSPPSTAAPAASPAVAAEKKPKKSKGKGGAEGAAGKKEEAAVPATSATAASTPKEKASGTLDMSALAAAVKEVEAKVSPATKAPAAAPSKAPKAAEAEPAPKKGPDGGAGAVAGDAAPASKRKGGKGEKAASITPAVAAPAPTPAPAPVAAAPESAKKQNGKAAAPAPAPAPVAAPVTEAPKPKKGKGAAPVAPAPVAAPAPTLAPVAVPAATATAAKAPAHADKSGPKKPVEKKTAPPAVAHPTRERAPAPVDAGAAASGHSKVSVTVPRILVEWCGSEEGVSFARQVANKTGVLSVKYSIPRQGVGVFEVEALSREASSAAKSLLELHLQHQAELSEIHAKSAALDSDLAAVRTDFEAGLRTEFTVPVEVLGLVIGKQGMNITRVKEATKVDRIVVDREVDPPLVRIRGDTAASVQAAKRMLEFAVQEIPLTTGQIKWVVGAGGSSLMDIRERSKVLRLEIEDSVDASQPPKLKITGLRTNVETAKMLVEAQLEYQDKFEAANALQRETEAKLRKMDQAFGDTPPRFTHPAADTRRRPAPAPAADGAGDGDARKPAFKPRPAGEGGAGRRGDARLDSRGGAGRRRGGDDED